MINEYNHLDGTWRRFLFQNFCILVKRIERVKLKRKVILFTYSFNQIAEFNIIIYMSVLYFCVFACIWSPFYGNPQRKACKTQKDPLQSFLIYSLALKFKMDDSLSVQCHPHIPTPTLIDDARELMVFCCNTKCVWIVSFCVIGSRRI